MVSLPTTHVLSYWFDGSELVSALPEAPVVPFVEPVPHLHRARAATAGLLYWLGDVTAPARPAHSSRTLG